MTDRLLTQSDIVLLRRFKIISAAAFPLHCIDRNETRDEACDYIAILISSPSLLI